MGTLGCVTKGATMVFPGEGFDPRATLKRGRRGALHRRSTACRPCSSRMLGHPDFKSFDLTSLRTGIMAGAPCPIEVMKQVDLADAHVGGDDRLRHDRDQPGVLPERRRRSAGEARLDASAASIRMSRSR